MNEQNNKPPLEPPSASKDENLGKHETEPKTAAPEVHHTTAPGSRGTASPGSRGTASPGSRGTAAMDPDTRKAVARKGGLAVSRNREHMAEIGRKGGQSVSKNREHMAEIGRKGGAASRSGSES